jgi:hypothetical protein
MLSALLSSATGYEMLAFSCQVDTLAQPSCPIVPMAWAEPQFSREEVNIAGRILLASTMDDEVADFGALEQALSIVNNWRSSHAFPLNTFQIGLRKKVRKFNKTGLVAQRIKRLS